MLWTLLAIYFKGSILDSILSARFLPTLTKKSLNEFAIVTGLVVESLSIINSDCNVEDLSSLAIISLITFHFLWLSLPY